jgi:uncharacterized protein with HEPN domain
LSIDSNISNSQFEEKKGSPQSQKCAKNIKLVIADNFGLDFQQILNVIENRLPELRINIEKLHLQIKSS